MSSSKLIVNALKQSNTLEKSENNIYVLTHTYDHKPRRFYVEAPYTFDTFDAICAYVQFECAEIDECYSIDQTEVIEVLEKFYDCKQIKRTSGAAKMDLYHNWEYFCGSDVQSVEYLKRDGMNEYFQKYIDKYNEKDAVKS